jgi:hypothetical protein
MATQSTPRKLIAHAVKIIECERNIVVQSYTDLIGAHRGKVTDYDARRWIRDYDRFLKPARAYLGRKPR